MVVIKKHNFPSFVFFLIFLLQLLMACDTSNIIIRKICQIHICKNLIWRPLHNSKFEISQKLKWVFDIINAQRFKKLHLIINLDNFVSFVNKKNN